MSVSAGEDASTSASTSCVTERCNTGLQRGSWKGNPQSVMATDIAAAHKQNMAVEVDATVIGSFSRML